MGLISSFNYPLFIFSMFTGFFLPLMAQAHLSLAVVTLAATSAKWAPADTNRVQTYSAHAVCFSLVSMAVLLTPRLQIPWDPDWH